MVDTARPQAHLGDLETPALTQQHVFFGYTHVVVGNVHVAVGSVVFGKHMHGAFNHHTRGIFGHQNHRLLLVWWRIGAGAHHGDQNLATRAAGPRDVVFFTVDDPKIAIQHRRGGNVLGIRRGMVHLGHGIGGTDFAVEQRLEPLLFLGRCAHPLQHFHVAGVGCRAVHAFRCQGVFAQFNGNVGVVQVGQALASVGIGEEEVPQAFFFGLLFGTIEQIKLAGRIVPAVSARAAFAQRLVFDAHRVHRLLDEALDMLVQRNHFLRHAQIIQVIVGAQRERRGSFGGGDLGHGVVSYFNGTKGG